MARIEMFLRRSQKKNRRIFDYKCQSSANILEITEGCEITQAHFENTSQLLEDFSTVNLPKSAQKSLVYYCNTRDNLIVPFNTIL